MKRKTEEYSIRCMCRGYHYLWIYRDEDDKDVNFIMTYRPTDIWGKIKAIWDILTEGGWRTNIDVLITDKEAKKLGKWLNDL